MNANQRQTIYNHIDDFRNINLYELIASQYPDQSDLSNTIISFYSVGDFVTLLNRMFNQLHAELGTEFWYLLPNSSQFQNDFGTVKLDTDVANLISYLNQGHLKEAETQLQKLIFYQVLYGFWDKSAVRMHDIDRLEVESIKERIDISSQSLTEQIQKFNEQRLSIDALKQELSGVIEKAGADSQIISQQLENAHNTVASISILLNDAKLKDEEFKGILKLVNEKLETVKTDITTYQTEFTSIKTENSALKQSLEETISNAAISLKEAQEGNNFIQSRKSQIELLTGMAADGSLGSKFDQRKIELYNNLQFWKWAVPVMSILSIIWVVVVFTFLKADLGDEWVNLGVNLLKTTPAFILLGFVFAQYSKERNLQEEYAFKSTVAMTLTAYSNMLANSDIDQNKSRQEMLLKSIAQVYRQPQINADKSGSIFSFNTKHLKESVQTLTETVNNLKPIK